MAATKGCQMAEKDNKKEAEAQTGKKKKPILLFAVIGVVFLLAAAAGSYFFLFSTPTDEELEKEMAQETMAAQSPEKALEPRIGVIIELDPFVVNLADPKARHFVKTTIALELTSERAKDDVQKLMPKIRDEIILLLSSQTIEDILTMDGKIRLRDQIISRVNRIIGEGRVLNAYFSRLVVQ